MGEENKKSQNESQPRRFDQQQYERLSRCSDKKDITEWNKSRENNKGADIFLEGAIFEKANLENADFFGAHLENAKFAWSNMKGVKLSMANLKGAAIWSANLENALLDNAHLENTNFNHAYLKGACFNESYLQDSDFELAIVDGETSIWKCEVSRYTNFSGVGLDSIRIDPATKQLLECNIRRMNWEEWYKEHPKLKWFFKTFWWISDYGLSEKRIVKVFLWLVFIFSTIYYLWGLISPTGIIDNLFVDRNGVQVQCWIVPLRALYFSIITMTLGFSDMYAKAQSIWGHILIMLQAILGYVLLGALVTRFAIMFTAGGPAGRFANEKKK
jgi:hypothetical protein